MASKIVFISPYEELTKKIKYIVEDTDENIDVYTASFDEAVELCKELERAGTKVFISRSGNKKYIQKRIDSPVVDMGNNLGDYLEALKNAKNARGKIGVFSYEKKIDEIDIVGELLDIEIIQYIFKNENEAEEVVRQALKDGIIFGVGGVITGSLFKNTRVEYAVVNSTKDSIINAINTAKEVCRIQEEEKKRADLYKIQMEKYKAILNFSYNGIIAVDKDYKIDVFNPCAESLLNISSKYVMGKYIDDVIPALKLESALETGNKEINKISKINNKHITINKIPIYIEEEIKGAVFTFQDIKTIQEHERQIRTRMNKVGLIAKYTFDNIVGDSKAIKRSIEIAKGYAKTSSTVLIYGETGTGKELFAQSIHNYSSRSSKPFVAINCAALPESILESELFGYEEGTFTGGKKGGKMGLFELAHEGTIFLDEIAEIPINLQAQLLRVLQEKQIRRLGSDKIIPIDVRVITATNKDLAKEVRENRFRQDLFYRINILRLTLPSLRERIEDIKKLSISFILKNDHEFYVKNKKEWNQIFCLLGNYDWYGNVRELENVLERTLVVLRENIYSFNDYKDLLNNILTSENRDINCFEEANMVQRNDMNDFKSKYIVSEIEEIMKALKDTNFSRTDAAKQLKISRSTLWRKMKKYGINI